MAKEVYIGDGLYASYDGFQVQLIAPREDGDHVVYMDAVVLSEFLTFLEHTYGKKLVWSDKDVPEEDTES